MSLDCYPLGRRRSIDLKQQPMAMDVAYNDNLFVSVVDQCRNIVVHQLDVMDEDGKSPMRSFSLGDDIVVDEIVYCKTGDYLACVGHKNSSVSVYIVMNWRQDDQKPTLIELNKDVIYEESDKRDKVNSIDCCQQTGNLAVSCGDFVIIYKYTGGVEEEEEEEEDIDESDYLGKDDFDDEDSRADTIKECTDQDTNRFSVTRQFKHLISLRLSIWSLKVSLLENYLSIIAVDHVQVLKLELLTLQIQSNCQDGNQNSVATANSNSGSDPNNFAGPRSQTASTTSTTIPTTSCSMRSDTNSTTTNFSSLTNNNNASLINNNNNNSNNRNNGINNKTADRLNTSDMSIITMNTKSFEDAPDESNNGDSDQSTADDCITWNLNTKKLVKLPTLMHNTSSNLSSYHVCHPLELLGPACESIACRVSASIYAADLCQNQLEAVVLLCKQFDFDKEPVKSAPLQAIYLSSHEDQRRLHRCQHQTVGDQPSAETCSHLKSAEQQAASRSRENRLLKSVNHDLLVSVTCFVATLTNCFVYSLHGKKVMRTQTITNPALCLDLRPDLLNVYLLTPLGLQICSSGVCDSTFRYDWSSSSDLNLSFLATNKTRVLATSRFLVLVSPLIGDSCQVEYLIKPDLQALNQRIVHTVERCNSISIRSNMLTYLHATCQLALLDRDSLLGDQTEAILKLVTLRLCKQLLQKKQTNVITNGRIDKAIKHLLDISLCDLAELMSRHLEAQNRLASEQEEANSGEETEYSCLSSCVLNEDEDERPPDANYELIKIYLRQAKFSQSLLDYLVMQAADEQQASRLIGHLFELNPRLLIKCGQRLPHWGDLKVEQLRRTAVLLVEKLSQLVELHSTGINRATVLFTLAILHNALGARQKCLASLAQIKPLNHLAITMCSNYELAHPIAALVREHYPEVFGLFLGQLAKRDRRAAREMVERHAFSVEPSMAELRPFGFAGAKGGCRSPEKDRASFERRVNLAVSLDEDESTLLAPENQKPAICRQQVEEEDEEEEGWVGDDGEKKLRLLAGISVTELIELLGQEPEPASRTYLEASLDRSSERARFRQSAC